MRKLTAVLLLAFALVAGGARGQGIALTQASVSCGTSSTTLLTAGAATSIIRVHVPSAATASVWVNWAGAAAVTAAPSEDLVAGSTTVWTANGSYVPNTQINCIASSAQTVVVEYR